jgi:hypothetical protein
MSEGQDARMFESVKPKKNGATGKGGQKGNTITMTAKVPSTPQVSQSFDSVIEKVLQLQRTVGNRTVWKMVESGAIQVKPGKGHPGKDGGSSEVAQLIRRVENRMAYTASEGSEQTTSNAPPIQMITAGELTRGALLALGLTLSLGLPVIYLLLRHGRIYTKLRLMQIIQNRNLVHTIAGLTQVATAHPALSATEILRLGEVNGGSTPADLIAQVTNIAGNNIAHLIQLYNDGATAAQINVLLNHENNGATLHAQIQAIAGNSVADLVQLYNDNVTSAQIGILFPFENNGATLHAQIQVIAGNNVVHLIQLYTDGATSAQITTLLGHEPNGATLHAQIQAIAGNNVAHLIQLYADGATSAQITTLLGHEPNGATLHAQIQAIVGNNVAHLIQLYADGATSAQITTLLGHEPNGATLHAQIQAIAGNNVAHLIQLYADGATSAQITTLLALENNGATLHTYMPLILRQVADGLAINQNMIDRVQRQLGTVTALEGIQGANAGQNLVWGQQQMDLLGTAFGRWLLGGGPVPNPQTGNMNCWEVVLFGAYRAGYVNFAWLQNFYQQFAADLAGGNYTYIENNLAVGARRTHDPAAVAPLMPLRGDVVIFQQAVAHTAIATGNLRAGSPEVLSLWNTPNNHLYLQVVSVGDLLGEGAGQPVEFFSPNWT